MRLGWWMPRGRHEGRNWSFRSRIQLPETSSQDASSSERNNNSMETSPCLPEALTRLLLIKLIYAWSGSTSLLFLYHKIHREPKNPGILVRDCISCSHQHSPGAESSPIDAWMEPREGYDRKKLETGYRKLQSSTLNLVTWIWAPRICALFPFQCLSQSYICWSFGHFCNRNVFEAYSYVKPPMSDLWVSFRTWLNLCREG